MNQETLIDGHGNELTEGARVWTMDALLRSPVKGTLKLNSEHPHVSKWYVAYDDGLDMAVLEPSQLFKL